MAKQMDLPVERAVVLDSDAELDEHDALRVATERAEHAEAELARLKGSAAAASAPKSNAGSSDADRRASRDAASEDRSNSTKSLKTPPSPASAGTEGETELGGESELRKDSMMAHLLDSLAAGKDIGHYGRLTFAMVARHFMTRDEVLDWMTRDNDFSSEQAELMLTQVDDKDYSPPKRDRILAWQSEQEFPILPDPRDPDCGNLYRNLKFPDAIYKHISHYQEEKMHSDE